MSKENLARTTALAKSAIRSNMPANQRYLLSVAICELEHAMENRPAELSERYGKMFWETLNEYNGS